MMTKTTNLPPLPKLPFGQGSYAYQKMEVLFIRKLFYWWMVKESTNP